MNIGLEKPEKTSHVLSLCHVSLLNFFIMKNHTSKTSFWGRIYCLLFGLDRAVYNLLSDSNKRKYRIKFMALVLTVILSISIALEVCFAFDVNSRWIVPICLSWAVFMFFVDIIILNMRSPYARLIISFGIVTVSSILLLSFIGKKDVLNQWEAGKVSEIEDAKKNYYNHKDTRFLEYSAILKQEKDEIEPYHNSVCVPEMNNGFAHIEFRKKHKRCKEFMTTKEELKNRLTEDEKPYYKDYLATIKNIKHSQKPGIIESAELAIHNFLTSWVKKILGLGLVITILGIDLLALFVAFSFRDEEYKIILKQKNELNTGRVLEELQANHRYAQDNQNLQEKRWSLDNKFRALKILSNAKSGLSMAKAKNPEMPSALVSGSNKLLDDEIAIQIYRLNSEIQDQESDLFEIQVEKVNDNKVESKNPPYSYTTFYCTLEMKRLADVLWADANNDPDKFLNSLYEWSVEHIKYNHDDYNGYKTAREVFQNRLGVCGEMAIFFIAMARYKGLKVDYIHVFKDKNGKVVNHACAGTYVNGKYQLIDVAYSDFNCMHQQWNKKTDNELFKNMEAWNKQN